MNDYDFEIVNEIERCGPEVEVVEVVKRTGRVEELALEDGPGGTGTSRSICNCEETLALSTGSGSISTLLLLPLSWISIAITMCLLNIIACPLKLLAKLRKCGCHIPLFWRYVLVSLFVFFCSKEQGSKAPKPLNLFPIPTPPERRFSIMPPKSKKQVSKTRKGRKAPQAIDKGKSPAMMPEWQSLFMRAFIEGQLKERC